MMILVAVVVAVRDDRHRGRIIASAKMVWGIEAVGRSFVSDFGRKLTFRSQVPGSRACHHGFLLDTVLRSSFTHQPNLQMNSFGLRVVYVESLADVANRSPSMLSVSVQHKKKREQSPSRVE
mmetsp:Transcript_16317/g.36030  ORF Transcript_16317/g.36030 Transcript_16317/m.36030 type:complete len:122 (-) Transcript_16317:41-406(-)